MLIECGVDTLEEKHISRIQTICELHRQQCAMYANQTHQCERRIVSLRQPHVRPIVRGKAGKKVEFGQKMALSVVGGYTFVERQDYENFNEGTDLIASVERYRERFGFYPEAVLADQIYRNRGNRKFCQEHGIRLSSLRLGRPKIDEKEVDAAQTYKDNCERNTIEGRIGNAKRRFGLDLIMAYLPETALTEAALQVLCLNFAIWLRFVFSFFRNWFFGVYSRVKMAG